MQILHQVTFMCIEKDRWQKRALKIVETTSRGQTASLFSLFHYISQPIVGPFSADFIHLNAFFVLFKDLILVSGKSILKRDILLFFFVYYILYVIYVASPVPLRITLVREKLILTSFSESFIGHVLKQQRTNEQTNE